MYFKLSVAILLAEACANAQSIGSITPTGSLSGRAKATRRLYSSAAMF
jgi:hypothetical protein